MRTSENYNAAFARSSTAPANTTESGASTDNTNETPARPQHTRRPSSISFAAPPVDRAFQSPTADALPTLQVASIGAVTRNFVALGKDYLDARPSQRDEALKRLSQAGARMFADYVVRESQTHPNSTWTGRGIRALNNALIKHDTATRGSVLGELTALRTKLTGFDAFIEEANDRRSRIASDVKTFMADTFNAHGLQRSPQLEGMVLGCMLQGATVSLAEACQDAAQLAELGPALVAFGNALERTFGPRVPAAPRPGTEALPFWLSALSKNPEAILKRFEEVVVSAHAAGDDFLDAFEGTREAAVRTED